MIIGVISDTHGNRRTMHEVADLIRVQHGVEVIFHVGDDYVDAEELAMAGHVVKMVPGLWCPEYANPRIPNRIVERLDGLTISAAHAEKDLHARELAATIVLTGHTHVAVIQKIGRSLYVNPGHLKRKLDRGQRPSYVVIATSPEQIQVAIHELTGEVREARTFSRDELA